MLRHVLRLYFFCCYQLDVCYHLDGKKLVVLLFCYQLDIWYHLFAKLLKFIVDLHLFTSASSPGPKKKSTEQLVILGLETSSCPLFSLARIL